MRMMKEKVVKKKRLEQVNSVKFLEGEDHGGIDAVSGGTTKAKSGKKKAVTA